MAFDIPREVSVYADQAGRRWWTKAWFNHRRDGEAAVPVSRETALGFWDDRIGRDEMLEEYFPRQMQAYHAAIEQTRQQLSEAAENRQQHLQ